MKSHLTVIITVEHEQNIPSAIDLTRYIARAVSVEIGQNPGMPSRVEGRRVFVGREGETDVVTAFLQSAAITVTRPVTVTCECGATGDPQSIAEHAALAHGSI